MIGKESTMIGKKVMFTQVVVRLFSQSYDLCSLHRNVEANWDSDRKIDVNYQPTDEWGGASNQNEGDYLVPCENCEDWALK